MSLGISSYSGSLSSPAVCALAAPTVRTAESETRRRQTSGSTNCSPTKFACSVEPRDFASIFRDKVFHPRGDHHAFADLESKRVRAVTSQLHTPLFRTRGPWAQCMPLLSIRMLPFLPARVLSGDVRPSLQPGGSGRGGYASGVELLKLPPGSDRQAWSLANLANMSATQEKASLLCYARVVVSWSGSHPEGTAAW